MQIKTIEYGSVDIPLRVPFRTALRTVRVLESILVRITTTDGMVGYGETAASKAVTGETLPGINSALKHIAGVLEGKTISMPRKLQQMLYRLPVKSRCAKAAMEIALYDLWSQRAGQPLYRYLGGSNRELHTAITISLAPVSQMVEEALGRVEQGFGTLKIKLGENMTEDLHRVETITAAIDARAKIILDANQAWQAEEAVAFMKSLQMHGITVALLEQPVPREEIGGMRYIKEHIETPLLADESVFGLEDAQRVLQEDAADLINIKLDKCAGITQAVEIARYCGSVGKECMMGCMLEGAVSVSAAAHVAAAIEQIVWYDLDAPLLCLRQPVIGGAQFDGAAITLSESIGLGIEHIDGVEWREL